jgi:VanZ family protein
LTPDQKQILKTWIAAALWIGIIAVESTEYLSSENTSRFLYPLFRFLFSLEPRTFEIVHHYLRKMGHFVGYFTLSLLLFRAWKSTIHVRDLRVWAMRWAGIAFGMSVLIASLDEWHQTFLPSRTGRVADVVLDSSAALTAQIVIFLYWQWRSARMTRATSS